MECSKADLDNFNLNNVSSTKFEPEKTAFADKSERYIYKVDVGSMRGFDKTFLPNNIQSHLGSRTPQVLEIRTRATPTKKDVLRILRSTILNTRIHQPRPA